MASKGSKNESWWAKGLLFENCTCQLLCPAHVSFKQQCEGEQCFGYWGIHFTQGAFGFMELQSQNAAVLYRASPAMFEGNWTLQLYLDDSVDVEQQNLAPMSFLVLYWQQGAVGAVQMGFKHGMYCIGCCWLLMMPMFVGGIMGFYWMLGIAIYVFLEKIIPRGDLFSKVGGVTMGLSGVFWLLQI